MVVLRGGMAENDNVPITLENISSDQAIVGLGVIVSTALRAYGGITVFINSEGAVEVAPFKESALDSIPEDHALSVLMDAGYSDSKLAAYLKGRDARAKIR
jgi:hypothetical protein